MKKFIAFSIVISISIIVFAQQNYQDVVYLKNGSIIRGIIIEQIPNKSIKLETAGKSVFVYQIDEIEKMTKEVSREPLNNSTNNPDSQKGYIVSIGGSKKHLTTDFQDITEIPTDKAIIYVYRPYKYVGSGVHFIVYANGNPISDSYLYVKGYFVYYAEPGRVAFSAAIGGVTTDLIIEVEKSKSYYVEGSVGMGGWMGNPSLELPDQEKARKKISKCKLISSY
ncbi:MAG: hypothetical protein NT004_09730 [Bacteroidetes bacterium]|nr:hypothetical protein [Bacteroidota bacterium]